MKTEKQIELELKNCNDMIEGRICPNMVTEEQKDKLKCYKEAYEWVLR